MAVAVRLLPKSASGPPRLPRTFNVGKRGPDGRCFDWCDEPLLDLVIEQIVILGYGREPPVRS
jgi:hypothetical protein